MLTEVQALDAITKELGLPIKAWIKYRDIYLARVEFPSPEERDYDPFFSVDPVTGEVRDFSVLTDGDIDEIARLFSEKYGT